MQSEVIVGNGVGILVYRTGNVSLFIILKNRYIKNILFKNSL
jgi:hypothetical protein